MGSNGITDKWNSTINNLATKGNLCWLLLKLIFANHNLLLIKIDIGCHWDRYPKLKMLFCWGAIHPWLKQLYSTKCYLFFPHSYAYRWMKLIHAIIWLNDGMIFMFIKSSILVKALTMFWRGCFGSSRSLYAKVLGLNIQFQKIHDLLTNNLLFFSSFVVYIYQVSSNHCWLQVSYNMCWYVSMPINCL